MIVDCALYRAGAREEVGDFSEALERARSLDDAFVWIGLYEPSGEEFELITSEFNLHPLAVEDAVKAHQRPKLDQYGDTVFLVIKTIRYIDADELIETGEIALFLGAGFVVSVRHGEARPLADIRHRLEGSDTLVKCGVSAVLHAIIDAVVDDYLAVAIELELDIDQIEQQVFGAGRDNHAERAYGLKRETLEFKRAVLPLTPVLDRLARGDVPNIHVDSQAFFKDVLDHNLRASETIESLDALLTSVLDANLAKVNVQQSEDMRRISAWVAIAAVQTMLAGVWGMNFEHMPELKWQFGYAFALGVMAAAGLIVYRLFKRAGWL